MEKTTKIKFKNYMSYNRNWVDWIWFIFFASAAIITPFILQATTWYVIDTAGIISMVSAAVGFLGGLLLLQRNKWHAAVGIPANALLGVVLWMTGGYAVAVINWSISPMIHLYGVWKWNKAKKGGHTIEAKQMTLYKGLAASLGLATLFGVLGVFLVFVPGSTAPTYVRILDAALGTMFLAAMILASLMYKEQYWAWLLIDIISIIYFSLIIAGVGYGGIQYWAIPTMVLFIGYFLSSIWGHYKWREIR